MPWCGVTRLWQRVLRPGYKHKADCRVITTDQNQNKTRDHMIHAFSLEPLGLPPPQPLTDCLLAQPCDACLGVTTFICKRNRRVNEALKLLDSAERLEEGMADLTATNAKLLNRALLAEVTSRFFQRVRSTSRRQRSTRRLSSCYTYRYVENISLRVVFTTGAGPGFHLASGPTMQERALFFAQSPRFQHTTRRAFARGGFSCINSQ